MNGQVVDARANYNRVVYEADGEYGYLDIIGFATLSTDDIIEGPLDNLGRQFILINGEGPVEVCIGNYGIPKAKALKALNKP